MITQLKTNLTGALERLGFARAAIASPGSAPEDLRRALSATQDAAAEARAERDRLAAARPSLLVTADDDALAAHDAAAAQAQRSIDRAEAMEAPLAERIAVAEREAAAEHRRRLIERAERLLRAAEDQVAREIEGFEAKFKLMLDAVKRGNAMLEIALAGGLEDASYLIDIDSATRLEDAVETMGQEIAALARR
ncbi:MAG TPA: hypothetical protein VGH40_11795 [Roseiarcus sp.]|jgi:hypothetical protein